MNRRKFMRFLGAIPLIGLLLPKAKTEAPEVPVIFDKDKVYFFVFKREDVLCGGRHSKRYLIPSADIFDKSATTPVSFLAEQAEKGRDDVVRRAFQHLHKEIKLLGLDPSKLVGCCWTAANLSYKAQGVIIKAITKATIESPDDAIPFVTATQWYQSIKATELASGI